MLAATDLRLSYGNDTVVRDVSVSFDGTGGVALVGAGLAIWSGLATVSLNDRYMATNDPAMVAQAYDDAQGMQTLANIFIFSSAGLGVAAVVLAIFTDWNAFGGGAEASASLQLRPSLAFDSGGAHVGLEGSF